MKKKSLILLSILVTLTVAIGYISKSFAEEKPKVAVVLKDLNSQYWEIVKAGAEKGFRDFGMDGQVLAPVEGTAEEQGEILMGILQEDLDVLIVSPTYPDYIIPILDEFVAIGIPVLLLDTDHPWPNKTSYIGTDNIDLGKKAGALLASQLQPGDKVAMIGGDSNSPVSGGRITGARERLKDVGIYIAAEKLDLSNDSSSVKKATKEVLQGHSDIKGIIASNDTLALHVIEVLQEHDLAIPVTGADGIIEMIELIEDEVVAGSVAQNPYDMGYLSVETALRTTNGEQVEKMIDSGVDIIIKGNAKQRLDFLKNLLR
ncbi:sugar ABC transporter substrate-binding protein [Halalkalibacter kiskunsagensis]|uniref:Sugar ABC transporter substrate-binding protein n=1 Tax=Halalkalibacter kiskunsagensis TaxID=1548599 RepID=A0ABV6KFJ2_9BACI